MSVFYSVPNYFKTRSAWDFFDDVFNTKVDTWDGGSILDLFDLDSMRYNNRFSSGDFPPATIKIDKKSKQAIIEVALVGCTEDDFALSYEDGRLILRVCKTAKAQEAQDTREYVYLQNGLQRSKTINVTTSWVIDSKFYDIDKMNVDYKNGLLTITINPREIIKEEVKRLFGNLKSFTTKTLLDTKNERVIKQIDSGKETITKLEVNEEGKEKVETAA
jgi:HSP20 family molecular chaperone IbpA